MVIGQFTRSAVRQITRFSSRTTPRPLTDNRVSINDQVLMVCPTVIPKYSLTSQNPASLTWEKDSEPAPTASTTSETWLVPMPSTRPIISDQAVMVATVAEPVARRISTARIQASTMTGKWAPSAHRASSVFGELEKFLRYGYGEGNEPVTFARYTGQETGERRQAILRNPPDILLTNYVMLELMLTRPEERRKLVDAANGLQFLVLDELHTYRGRQGADVAMLVRRVRDACRSPNMQCVGTSATMASAGSEADQRRAVAEVATELFGAEVTPGRVIGETLEHATTGDPSDIDELTREIGRGGALGDYSALAQSSLGAWIETTFGLAIDKDSGRVVRRQPARARESAARLADETGQTVDECDQAVRTTLLAGSAAQHAVTGRAAVRLPVTPVPLQGRHGVCVHSGGSPTPHHVAVPSGGT